MAFQKGKSGNPSGKRKEKLLSDALNIALKRMDPNDRTAAQRIANNLVKKALEGDMMAIKEVFDRHEGKAPQAIEHAGFEGGSLVIENIIVDPRNIDET